MLLAHKSTSHVMKSPQNELSRLPRCRSGAPSPVGEALKLTNVTEN